MKARVLFLGLALLASICFVGCDGGAKGRVSVNGTVTINGEPVKEGSITFLPAQGTTGPASGTGIADGKYSIPANKGVMPGSYTVQVDSFVVTRGMKPNLMGEMEEGEITVSVLPKEYSNDMGKAEKVLTADIQKGKNTIDFALEGAVPEVPSL